MAPFRIKLFIFSTKSITRSPSSSHEKKANNIQPCRFLPLLSLFLYAGISILSPAITNPSDLAKETGSQFFDSSETRILLKEKHLQVHEEKRPNSSIIDPCSSLIAGEVERLNISNEEGFLCCDRSHYRTDICYMRGNIQTDSPSKSIIVHNTSSRESTEIEKIKPYTRKWEESIMKTIDEITLKPINRSMEEVQQHTCDIHHVAPALVFSTGGYTGNVYHEFNDGLLPLYITSEKFRGEVVLVVVEFHKWWISKYGGIIKKLTNYEVVDFKRDKRVHCFKEMIVGLKIHGELTITPSTGTGKGIQDFQKLLGEGLLGSTTTSHVQLLPRAHRRPKLVIFTRNKSRVMVNMREIVKACIRIGFTVHIINPKRDTRLVDIYHHLNSADVMIGVHGAAMTHFLFMQSSSVFIEIVPLGLDWAAEEYYGQPAKKLGLEYMEYRINVDESSLSTQYHRDDTILTDPVSVNRKGWAETKKIYLEKQNVRIDVKRFRRLLEKAHSHILKLHSKSHSHSHS